MNRQMKRFWLFSAASFLCAAAFLVPNTAHAESPITGISELRFGAYYPSIDDEEGIAGQPFADTFGEGNRLLFSFETGRHIIQGYGALGVSVRIGYSSFDGDAVIEGAGDADIDESTDFQVLPLSASVYYRLDIAEKRWSIPLVPVVKGGLDYIPWWSNAGDGDRATFEGDDASGGKAGWHLAAGLHLHLDWLEPGSSAKFDAMWGVNNTYAFAEYMMLQADDFGGEGFDLSDDMWTFGLAFEF